MQLGFPKSCNIEKQLQQDLKQYLLHLDGHPEKEALITFAYLFYISLSKVCTRYDVGTTWVYDKISKGEFPAPKKFGYMSRWSSQDLLQWEIDNGWRDQEQEQKGEAS